MKSRVETSPVVPYDKLHNIIVYMGDTISFITGLSFIPASTVLVGLASRLTDDKVLMGVVAMSWSVSWLIPQLVAARLVHGRKRQKPYLIIPSVIGRQMVLLFALWLVMTRASSPLLTLWMLIIAVVLFNICDAIAGIAWFDMMSRNLTPRRRGRTIALAQLIGSILGIGSGLIVERILAPGGLEFPLNYAVIFTCAWGGFMVSLVIIFFLQENPMSEETLNQSHEDSFVTHVREALASDEVYRRLLLARILTGIESMAAAFYVIFITRRLQLPDSAIGVFSIAYIAGGILGVSLFGMLADRYGPRRVIHAATVLQFIAPTLAFIVALLPDLSAASPDAAYAIFIVILAINGAVVRSNMLGFSGYAIDRAPEQRRAIYLGVFNTLGGVVALSPVLGGAFLTAVSAPLGEPTGYTLMFGAVALSAGAGMLISLTLPKPPRS
ncbi:MAG TPA: MFS transporter [Anaerolineae bacterium]